MKCLRVVIHGEEHPTYTITKAFKKKFSEVETVWWQDWYNNKSELNRGLKEKLDNNDYDFVFMQIQEGDVIYPETLENACKRYPIFNWTGDVRSDVSYFTQIGNQTITLFSNDTDTYKMRELGFRSEYLQTGYDHAYYYNTNQHRLNHIVFIANNYNHNYFEQSSLRQEMVIRLYNEFKDDFKLYGNTWGGIIPNVSETRNKEMENDIYNKALISVNIPHINCARYYSDRQLRAMAAGTLVLTQDYHDLEKEFKVKQDLDTWKTFDELIDKCKYYINNREEALKIGENASKVVLEKCTWDYRMIELEKIINKYSIK
jgi:spore maturation protein CgeB